MWNYADIWESIAGAIPDLPAQIRGPRQIKWADFDRRANALARRLLDLGLTRQSKVAAYLYNGPEYLETYYATFKAGFAPVNTNYRYVADELVYLFDNADAEAVVFGASFAETEPGHPVPPFAEDYDAIVAANEARVVAPWGRSDEDMLILYTGGTTGMPKGVMWRLNDLFNVLGGGGNLMLGTPPLAKPEEAAERVLNAIRTGDPMLSPQTTIAAAPLMHGTAQFTGLMVLTGGGWPRCRRPASTPWSSGMRRRD
jgi:3-oxocholest-4-en-26-oate---CoA ligase